ncbi:LuxR C-terminal-related transcriptional regulator [Occultella gossypii]|uniref:AAA family ATPase n=1 Tax=Occultella gossypii TaxID=2800820 RepID=A0ABS7S6Z2_9MICO|nr:LuxR C-terminal-related transcriptional regulator [Occultella gossypii]MBZ2195852.1 AAA family ATPase [Occultella gossypii]
MISDGLRGAREDAERVMADSGATGVRHPLFDLAAREETSPEPDGDMAWATTTPSAKIEVPNVGAHLLERRGLLDRLTECVADHPLTLVTAPAGYGKSTLLTMWCSRTDATVAWLTIDEFDNDPRRLFRGLVNALRTAVRRSGRSDGARLLALVPRYRVDPEQYDALLTALEELRTPIVLIIDDLHAVDDVASREVVGRLMRFAPPNLRLILSGRSDPNLPVHKRRLDGELGELREADLCFDRAEVAALAVQSGLELDEPDTDLLLESTGGWPVATRMAIVALGASTDRHGRLQAMGGAELPLTGYLTDEILGTLRPELAEFILHATIGDRIRGDLAEVLHPHGAALLEECVRLGVFLTALGGDEQEFRWHALFASQCRAILQRNDPEAALSLRRRAARYWAPVDVPLAVSLAVAGGDGTFALELVLAQWPDRLLRGETELLRRLCAQLPSAEADDAEILLVLALCEFLDQRSTSSATRARAQARAATLPTERARHVELVDALLQLFVAGRDTEVVTARDRVRELLPSDDTGDRAVEAFAHFLLGETAVRLDDDPAGALADLQRAEDLASGCDLHELAAASTAMAPVPLWILGRFDEAARLARAAVDDGRRAGRAGSSSLVPAHLVLGVAEYWRDHTEQARGHLEEAIRRAQPRQGNLRRRAALVLMIVGLSTDDAALVEVARVTAQPDPDDGGGRLTEPIAEIVEAIREDVLGDPVAALARVTVMDPGQLESSILVWIADLHRRAGSYADARAVLAGIPASRRTAHIAMYANLTEALMSAEEGAVEEAHVLLERTLRISFESDLTRPLVLHGNAIAPLLSEHLAWGTQYGTTVGELVTRMRDRVPLRRSPSFWELTDREMTVLTYLRSPMTAAEIGRSLFVSANTVKTHMRAVYRKLGASGRREAVRIAVERDLL